MKNTTIVLSIIILIVSAELKAQNNQVTEVISDSIHLQAVDILGFRSLTQSKEKTNLSSREIMSHDAGAILSRIPSINGIRKGGGYGFDPVLRGFKYSQVGILIDGIQTTTVACPNRMDPPTSQVSVNTLSSVEVIKGPYSLRYGNNIGGVINFRSQEAGSSGKNGMYSRFSGGFESNGSIVRTEALAGYSSDKVAYQLAGSFHNGENYLDGDGNNVPAAFRRANVGMNIKYTPGTKNEYKVNLTRNFARDAAYPALPMDLRSDDTWLIQLGHNINLSASGKTKLSTSAYASLVDHLMDNYDKVLEPRMVNAETAVKTKNIGARSEWSKSTAGSKVFAGFDLNFENADGYRTREFLMGPMMGNTVTDNVWQNGHITRSGIFMEYQGKKEKLRYSIAGRVNLNISDASDADESFASLYSTTQSRQVNPALTGGIEYSGANALMAIWAGRVQRSGNLSERFMNSFPVGLDPYELIGNPELLPEVNNQLDLIIAPKLGSNNYLEIDLFYSYLQNFISSTIRSDLTPKMPTAPGVRQYDNIDRASITGIEVSFVQDLPLLLSARFDAAAQLGTNLVTGEALPEIPPVDLRLQLKGSYLQQKLQPAVTTRYVFQQDRISTEFGENATPSFFLLDLDINYQLLKVLQLSAGIRNVFDTSYYEHLNRSISSTGLPIYNPGRNFYLGFSMSF